MNHDEVSTSRSAWISSRSWPVAIGTTSSTVFFTEPATITTKSKWIKIKNNSIEEEKWTVKIPDCVATWRLRPANRRPATADRGWEWDEEARVLRWGEETILRHMMVFEIYGGYGVVWLEMEEGRTKQSWEWKYCLLLQNVKNALSCALNALKFNFKAQTD